MRLGAKQELFSRLLPRLLDKAHELGFSVRMGEVLRFEEQARWNSTHCRKCDGVKEARVHEKRRSGGHTFRRIGILRSLHRLKLAVDLILFTAGVPHWNTAAYRELGEWWEAQSGRDFECCWGGRFSDGGHFSIGHGGRK